MSIRLMRPRNIALLVVLLALIAAAAITFVRFQARHRSHEYADLKGWQTISGRWTLNHGEISNPNYGRGDLLIARDSQGSDYRISADVRFDLIFSETHYGDAGLVIRTTDPQPGVDSYEGYYVGLRPDEQTLVLGRASYEWKELDHKHLNPPLNTGTWYHLELAAKGCHLSATAAPLGSQSITRLDYDDKDCLTSGAAGLRSFYTQATWKNIVIRPW